MKRDIRERARLYRGWSTDGRRNDGERQHLASAADDLDAAADEIEERGRLISDYFAWAYLSETTKQHFGRDAWAAELHEKGAALIAVLTDDERARNGL